MTRSTRRTFLQHSAAAAIGAAAWSAARPVRAAGANERMVLGLIGCGGQGNSLAKKFVELADFAYVCDPDETRCRQTQESVRARQAVSDLRRVLDDKSVDAVVIATPDHWHAPAAILACQAGKHVYVEKPQSHNLRESRLLLDAARRNNVVVQHGTQSRTDPLVAGAVRMLREGLIGDILIALAWNVQQRKNIGHAQPSDPPAAVDYDLWVGPAEFMPYQENRFHYNWHWWHNFGTGDIGNDGTHEIDYARWGLAVEGLPATVTAIGGKYVFDDDQQFPDTATCAFEWPGDGHVGHRRQLIFEMRLWDECYPYNCDNGTEFHGTAGRMLLSKRGKLEVYDRHGDRLENPQPKEPPELAASHQADFLDAVRNQRRPNADVALGHDSVALVHLANAAIRAGRGLQLDPQTEQLRGDEQANQLLGRTYREGGHWAIPRS